MFFETSARECIAGSAEFVYSHNRCGMSIIRVFIRRYIVSNSHVSTDLMGARADRQRRDVYDAVVMDVDVSQNHAARPGSSTSRQQETEWRIVMGQSLIMYRSISLTCFVTTMKRRRVERNIVDGGSRLVGGLGALIGLDANDTERTRRLFARSLFAPPPPLSTSSTMATALALPQSKIWLSVSRYYLAQIVHTAALVPACKFLTTPKPFTWAIPSLPSLLELFPRFRGVYPAETGFLCETRQSEIPLIPKLVYFWTASTTPELCRCQQA